MNNNSFARSVHVYFSFLDISHTFSSFPRREMICFAVVWTTWVYDDNVQFYLPTSKALVPINSSILRTHFASVMTLNNWETIAETRSYIFRWRFRCRRRRLCMSCLITIRLILHLIKRLGAVKPSYIKAKEKDKASKWLKFFRNWLKTNNLSVRRL